MTDLPLIGVRELAARLGVPEAQLRGWLALEERRRNPILPPRQPGRRWVFTPEQADHILALWDEPRGLHDAKSSHRVVAKRAALVAAIALAMLDALFLPSIVFLGAVVVLATYALGR